MIVFHVQVIGLAPSGSSAFRFLTNFLLIESNKKIEKVDRDRLIFNPNERSKAEGSKVISFKFTTWRVRLFKSVSAFV
jgi:hypothetical protein